MNKTSNFHLNNKSYKYFDLPKACQKVNIDIDDLPYSIRILFENILRNCEENVFSQVINDYKKSFDDSESNIEILFSPARILMQDFTGVPAIVDLAAMRTAIGEKAEIVNPMIQVDLVIDHSISVDFSNSNQALIENMNLEFERNRERYEFLSWGQNAFHNFRVVPPGTGICHQVNLEYLAQVVCVNEQNLLYPDTVFGTDSHTTMVNSMSVLGWGVGGIEAEAAMLGQPTSMLLPKVLGFHLTGSLANGLNATDLVLAITQILRFKGVVNKFVEFFGEGLKSLTLADRATISNMAPEYGATCGFFPIDEETIRYLDLTGRSHEHIELIRKYTKVQNLWYKSEKVARYNEIIELDLNSIQPSMAGPRRPQDRVVLSEVSENFQQNLESLNKNKNNLNKIYEVQGEDYSLQNGSIVLAAITSCTNTSNPFAIIGAGLLAKKAVELGLQTKPWVKTSFAPGSQVAKEYLVNSGLMPYLEKLGFYIVGYGCATCIGNSGPLKESISKTIQDNQLVVAAVLSGNRNFEGRIHPLIRANYLASPMLAIAYAIAGNISVDFINNKSFNGYSLSDIWPSNDEIMKYISLYVTKDIFTEKYKNVSQGNILWNKISSESSQNNNIHYNWNLNSTYIQEPPYFQENKTNALNSIEKAKILAIFGDSITTDHISPAGSIAANSPAAKYLIEKNITQKDFNSYGARRGAHEVMMRGTFANTRIHNKMIPEIEGGYTKHYPSQKVMSIYDAAIQYKEENQPVVVFAGKEYGTGSSRDWAAKGTKLLGVKAVIAESFERIHRSNLIGMGIIPLIILSTINSLQLKGNELISITDINSSLKPKQHVKCFIERDTGEKVEFIAIVRADTDLEIEYLKQGGILHYVFNKLKGM